MLLNNNCKLHIMVVRGMTACNSVMIKPRT